MFVDKNNIEKHGEGQNITSETQKYLNYLIMGLFAISLLITVVLSIFPLYEYSYILIIWDTLFRIWTAFPYIGVLFGTLFNIVGLFFMYGISISVILNIYSMIKSKKKHYKRAIIVTIIEILLYILNVRWFGMSYLYERWGDLSYIFIGTIVILIINVIIIAITSSKFLDTQTDQFFNLFNLKSPLKF